MAAQSIHYRLSMLGYTLPPHASAICNEKLENPAQSDWDCIEEEVVRMTYNVIHFAELLHFNPIPVIGNKVDDKKCRQKSNLWQHFFHNNNQSGQQAPLFLLHHHVM